MKIITFAGLLGLAGLGWVSPLQAQTNTALPTTFAPIVEKVAPSVVSIHTTKNVRIPKGLSDFFGLPGPGSGRERERGLGSGVIVSADGYILTNRHVVEAADEISVHLGDHREFKATKIGADPGTDIAVLKIETTGLPVLAFAESEKARVGDVVLAVGNPFGLTQTVTMGIISGLGRGGMGIVDYENFIQTDASINPGNSGGALVDMASRLVGINTAIFSRTGGNQGIGFAVPSDLAMEVLKNIREHGRVIRGYLGTIIQPVTPELAQVFKLKEPTGALVADVSPGSPADKAGLQQGDVITAINGKKVEGPRELRLMVGAMAPGTKATLKILRNDQEKDLSVELGELPDKESSITPNSGGSPGTTSLLDSLKITDLDDDTRTALKAPSSLKGALIVDIDPESEAYRAGLRQGFVITEINRKPVQNAADATMLSKSAKPGEPLLLRVWGEGQSRFLTITGK
jgi:serine protease Do